MITIRIKKLLIRINGLKKSPNGEIYCTQSCNPPTHEGDKNKKSSFSL